jgi:signal transduction histidine kinase
VPYELIFPLLLVIPLAYAVGIFKWHLLQIDQWVNRSVVTLMLLLIVALICLLPPFIFFPLWAVTPIQQSLIWGTVTLLIALIFAPLRQQLQVIADRLFYGGWYDYRSFVDEMSQALSRIMDAQELARLLVERLTKILRLYGAVLLLPVDQGTLAVAKASGWKYDNVSWRNLSRTGILAGTLSQIARPLTTLELRTALAGSSLSEEEQTWLFHVDIELWIPLVRAAKLQGILLLGTTADEGAFDAEDRSMLNTLACEAAIAVENIELVDACRRRADEINCLYSQLTQSREDERKRLARELHDQVIQDLVNLHYYLDVDALPLAPTARGHATVLRERMRSIIENLRQICQELRPPALDDLNLGLAIEGYIEDVNAKYDLNITLRVNGDSALIDALPEGISLCLFRALQEACTNARRHAQATQIEVELVVVPGHVTLEVRDNGQGFHCPCSLGIFIRGGHFGLAGLQERMNLVGGTLHIESAPGRGTILCVRAPLENTAAIRDYGLSEIHSTARP